MKRVYISGNYFIIEDDTDTTVDCHNLKTNIYFERNGTTFIFYRVSDNQNITSIQYANILDESGSTYSSIDAFTTILKEITGTPNFVDVNVQDQHTPVIVAKMSVVDAETTTTSTGAIDDRSIVVDDATGFVVGQYLSIFNVTSNRFFLANILSISTLTITIDSPLDFAFPSGSFVTGGRTDMAVDGSSTPVVFGLRNTSGSPIGTTVDITRIFITLLSTGAPPYDDFGDIVGGLTNGIILRSRNGVYKNIFNLKTNGELSGIMFDTAIADKVNPSQGQNGYVARFTLAGQDKIGVTIRLAPGEDLELIVQDDLTSLDLFEIVAEGHEVV